MQPQSVVHCCPSSICFDQMSRQQVHKVSRVELRLWFPDWIRSETRGRDCVQIRVCPVDFSVNKVVVQGCGTWDIFLINRNSKRSCAIIQWQLLQAASLGKEKKFWEIWNWSNARFKRRILHAPNLIAELTTCKMRRFNQLSATYFN